MTFALPLAPARCVFVDDNGKPLVGGTVSFYEPATLTPKDTWRDFDRQILNTNPITLDALGSAAIWGSGRYRQILRDSVSGQEWDNETAVLTDRPYEAGFYCGATPADNAVLADWPFSQAVTFPTNWVGSAKNCAGPPSGTTTVNIKKVSGASVTTIGSMSIAATTGVITQTSSVSDPNFQPGDLLRWQLSGSANGFSGLSANYLGALDG
jgi:hypothetical protein